MVNMKDMINRMKFTDEPVVEPEYEIVQIMPLPENMEVMAHVELEDGTFRFESLRDSGRTCCLALVEWGASQTIEVVEIAEDTGVLKEAVVVPVRYCKKCGERMWPHFDSDRKGDDAVFYVCDACDEIVRIGHSHYEKYEKNHGSERKF